MDFIRATAADADRLSSFWNTFAQTEILHKKLAPDAFCRLFLDDSDDVRRITVTASEDGIIAGFAGGCYRVGKDFGYITFVCVLPSMRRSKLGTRLLLLLEDELQSVARKTLTSYEVSFFNPSNLEWCIPNTPGHDHPNAPGADMLSNGYIWLKNCGYRDYAYQNSFYQPLAAFEFSDAINEKILWQRDQGLEVCFYDDAKHYGMAELLDDLGSEDWKNQFSANLAHSNPHPVLIAVSHKPADLDEFGRGKAIGFTGPLYPQASGRGYFAGIGIHSEYRKFGLGKVLFSCMCNALKEMGAQYMTLFTGETNPARNIYESAGFKIVRSWSDMRREVTQHDQRNRIEAAKLLNLRHR